MYYWISLDGYQTICFRSFSFTNGQQPFESINQSAVVYGQDHRKGISAEMKLPQNLNIYLYNYQTEAAIFLAAKHKKVIMTCSYLISY